MEEEQREREDLKLLNTSGERSGFIAAVKLEDSFQN